MRTSTRLPTSASAAVRSATPAIPTSSIPRPCGAADARRTSRLAPPCSRRTARSGTRLGAGGWYGRTRRTPPSPCAPTTSPTASQPTSGSVSEALSVLFEDLEDDLAVRAGRRGIQDGADRLGGSTLLADHPAEILLGDLQLEDRRSLALRLPHLDSVRLADELLRQEYNQLLHGYGCSPSASRRHVGRVARSADQLGDRLRRPRTLLQPGGERVGLEPYECGIAGGVVQTELRDVTAVARRFRVRDDDAVHRLLLAAVPGQTDPHCHGLLLLSGKPGKPCIMGPEPSFFSTFFVCVNCLISRFTSATDVPLPLAMRLRRLAFRMCALRRSWRVIESMIASTRLSSASAPLRSAPLSSFLTPGIMPIRSATEPIFLTVRSWSRKSSSVNSLRRSFLAMSSAAVRSYAFSARSMSDSTSPIPRMREAMRSGWNASSASSFSPVPTNTIGLPVTVRSESAAPPRASPSIFVRTTPLTGSRPAKPCAVATASCPVMASATSSTWLGRTAVTSASSSRMSSSSTVCRPAVSSSTVSAPAARAAATASRARAVGSPSLPGWTGTPSWRASVSSCSMAAGR